MLDALSNFNPDMAGGAINFLFLRPMFGMSLEEQAQFIVNQHSLHTADVYLYVCNDISNSGHTGTSVVWQQLVSDASGYTARGRECRLFLYCARHQTTRPDHWYNLHQTVIGPDKPISRAYGGIDAFEPIHTTNWPSYGGSETGRELCRLFW